MPLGALHGGMLVRAAGDLSGIDLLWRVGGIVTVVALLLFALSIVGFLIFEPRGLYGIWTRIRTYWKTWPFSY